MRLAYFKKAATITKLAVNPATVLRVESHAGNEATAYLVFNNADRVLVDGSFRDVATSIGNALDGHDPD